MRSIVRYIVLWGMILCPLWGYASPLLSVEEAFVATLQREGTHKLIINFKVKEGYRIYPAGLNIKFNQVELPFTVMSPQKAAFANPRLKNNPNQVSIYLTNKTTEFRGNDEIDITWQGCSAQGVCYLPQITHFIVNKEKGITRQYNVLEEERAPVSWAQQGENAQFSGSVWQTLLWFYFAGLLLAFTACMYPLIPIISSLIVGQSSSYRRAFLLSLIYVNAMAIVYAFLGGMAAWSGETLSVYLQNHWVPFIFAGFFILMALAMFGLFQFQLPARWQSWLIVRTQTLPKGQYVSAALLGSVSALLIGPCIAPPLAAALAYISQEGNVMLGMGSLYMIALGIGTPLLIIGLMGQKLLPRLHPKIMTGIQCLFGFILLGVALWIVRPFVPYEGWVLAASLWLGGMGVSCYRTRKTFSTILIRGLLTLIAVVFIGLGTLAALSVIIGERKLIQSLEKLTHQTLTQPDLAWRPIDSLASLKEALAMYDGKKILINFTADWCIACKEMTYFTLTDSKVRLALKDWVLLQVDLTHQTENKGALAKGLAIYGPPTWVFFDRNGEMVAARIVGYQNVDEFLHTLSAVEREVA